MVRTVHNAVFFTGYCSEKYAKTVWDLLAKNGAERIVFVDHLETLEMSMKHTDRMTFFIHGAPQTEGHLPLMDKFSRKAIVYLNFNGSGATEISSVLKKTRGVHVIKMDVNQETPTHRLHRIFRGLGGVRPSPINPSVVETILRKSKGEPRLFASAFTKMP